MPSRTWKGYISFGLISVSIRLYRPRVVNLSVHDKLSQVIQFSWKNA